MMTSDFGAPASPLLSRRATFLALAGFWGCFALLYTVRAAILGYPHPVQALARRLLVAGIGMALAWLTHRALSALRHHALALRIAVLAMMSLPCAVIFATANFAIFDIILPIQGDGCAHGPCTLHDLVAPVSEYTINWTFVFAAWGLLHLALAFAAGIREADHRAQASLEAARVAEIRALRYQINPHFLFNILNTLASLLLQRRLDQAESLISDIGRFFRYSLSADPVSDGELGDEFEMQRRYLELEQLRFADRLTCSLQLAPSVARARAPTMLLQPLVENAIKHGLERTQGPVHISIIAVEAPPGSVKLVITDNAVCAKERADTQAGFGIGLKNVGDRLRLRFGEAASFVAGPLLPRGYEVTLCFPLVLR